MPFRKPELVLVGRTMYYLAILAAAFVLASVEALATPGFVYQAF